ncbi:MAG TPA: allophanate hydrolase subunit 1 [Ilumatobacteraceae bacterium]|jgi:KipI family sensor histidine kinase inhibitor
MIVRELPYGATSALFEVDDTTAAIALSRWLTAHRPAGAIEIVPAARTVLVTCAAASDLAHARAAVDSFEPLDADDPTTGTVVEVPARYDGEDLAEVAITIGMSVAELIDLHCRATYSAAFCGFVPGFAYLTGLDPVLHLPRRPTPRARVPRGSVAIGANFTGVYPTASPGGWHLLGHALVEMFDPRRARPALIAPGDFVRFVAVTDA